MLTLALAPVIAGFLIFLGYITKRPHKTAHGESSYECGFISTEGQVWKPFMISFFIVGLLFLLFDLELLWIFPFATTSSEPSSFGVYIALGFFNFVIASLLYEILVETIKQI